MMRINDSALAQDFSFGWLDVGYAPIRAVRTFLDSIVSANRFAKEVEQLSHSGDSKLSELGLTTSEIVQHLARTSKSFRILG